MNNNLRLIIDNVNKKNIEEKHFFEKGELKIILDIYAKMVSEGSWNCLLYTSPSPLERSSSRIPSSA